jgi:hypothetical protein
MLGWIARRAQRAGERERWLKISLINVRTRAATARHQTIANIAGLVRDPRIGEDPLWLADCSYIWRGKQNAMKYLFAWIIGVPGLLVFVWFCMNHC